MTAKEYKNRLTEHEIFNGLDYLQPDEVKELRSEIKEREKAGAIVLSSFNNRASISKKGNVYTLTSYKTKVLSFDTETGEIKKLWNGYSVTTLKHINLFLQYFNIPGLNKREWIELETA